MPRQYTQEQLDNDVPELDAIYAEHRREQLKDFILDQEDEDLEEDDVYDLFYDNCEDYEEEF